MTDLIELRDVHFAYHPHQPVLRGANLNLGPSRRLALTGGNGSGKTTLLHVIVGLLRPHAGQVVAFGRPRCQERDFHEVRCRAGLLFQDPDDQLFCPTVLEDVAFGPVNRGHTSAQAHDIAIDTLGQLGLEGYSRRITHELSMGEKRLVALAAVLARQPDALLLDEPSANLDEEARRRLIDLLAGRDEAMLLVSHDADLVDRLCPARMHLRDGQVHRVG